jgi:hypothetical protein
MSKYKANNILRINGFTMKTKNNNDLNDKINPHW